jgi:hypothetical protein
VRRVKDEWRGDTGPSGVVSAGRALHLRPGVPRPMSPAYAALFDGDWRPQ